VRSLLTAGVALLTCALATGCSGKPAGAPGKGFAGLSSYNAATAASLALKQERANPDSPVYRKLLVVAGMSHDRSPGGHNAWRARLQTLDKVTSPYCIWVWSGGQGPFQENYVYDLDRCPTNGVG